MSTWKNIARATFFAACLLVLERDGSGQSARSLLESAVGENDREHKILLFTRAAETAENDPETRSLAFYNRGVARYELGRFDEALGDFKACLEIVPDDPDALLNAGLALTALDRFEESIRYFDAIIRIRPDSPIGYFNRGNAHLHMKEKQKAIEDYTRALDRSPFHVDALNNRAWAYFFTRQNSKALTDFERVLELSPEDPSALEGKRQIHEILDKQ
jgi:tetratricopeptide (TPR) repeat protein